MQDMIHVVAKWAVRLAGSISAVMLISGKSWGNTTLVAIEVFAIAMWAETEYSNYKSGNE